MRVNICKWCCSSLVCVTHQAGRVLQPPLPQIPVYCPFHHVGVDVIQFPKFHTGNRYGIVFIDYLTKWTEVFATSDQTALTIKGVLRGFLGFQETPFDSRTISIITSLSKYKIINTSYLATEQKYNIVLFGIFYASWSLTVSPTIAQISNITQVRFN